MKKLHFALVFIIAAVLNISVVFGSTAVIKTRLYYDGALREYQAEGAVKKQSKQIKRIFTQI
ncbi:MAG: hypothetical protein LIO44_05125, partial [Eubacterium sp.]|nr:hypothetical protein [Eubacterium sp.]